MTPIDYNNPNDMWLNNGYDPYKGLSNEERMTAGCSQSVCMAGAIIVALLICALFGSCTTTKYVPVPEYHTDTLRISHNTHDSIYVHDSTYIKEAGDTILIERWHTQWRDRWRTDTIYQSKRDSTPPLPRGSYQGSASRAQLNAENVDVDRHYSSYANRNVGRNKGKHIIITSVNLKPIYHQ